MSLGARNIRISVDHKLFVDTAFEGLCMACILRGFHYNSTLKKILSYVIFSITNLKVKKFSWVAYFHSFVDIPDDLEIDSMFSKLFTNPTVEHKHSSVEKD